METEGIMMHFFDSSTVFSFLDLSRDFAMSIFDQQHMNT